MPGITPQMAMILTNKNLVLVLAKVIGAIKLQRELDGSVEAKSRLGVQKWTTGRYGYRIYAFPSSPLMSNV